ncbi:hypothetical protein SLA2020_057530 [Shorea laevis]
MQTGLLSVQENVARRPTMASVVLLLSSNFVSLQVPSKPAFLMHFITELGSLASQSRRRFADITVNEATISDFDPIEFVT